MEKTLRILNGMVEDGIIEQYAIGGLTEVLTRYDLVHKWSELREGM